MKYFNIEYGNGCTLWTYFKITNYKSVLCIDTSIDFFFIFKKTLRNMDKPMKEDSDLGS